MPTIKVTVSEIVDVPEGSVVVLAPTGVVSAIRLPDGTEIKPWTSYEIESDGENSRDLSYEQLTGLDVMVGLDYERTVEVVEGDVPTVTHDGVEIE